MQAGFQYKLATIDDLHDYVAGTGEVFTYNVETSEGVFNGMKNTFLMILQLTTSVNTG
ncbi:MULTISPECIES: hypothetical protein [Bacillales]|uniref:hypothetical protein n=1 Tax=Peribacillus TaxID=2675229 RepID=UPI00177CDCDB|nr:hypothetical protein [Brevibacillus sp. JNUCC-41]QOS89255.1 hypothetical protein JNUCC41_21225 [Brevibacillus sp. JNUCC-41]